LHYHIASDEAALYHMSLFHRRCCPLALRTLAIMHNFVPLPAKRIVPFIGDQSHGGQRHTTPILIASSPCLPLVNSSPLGLAATFDPCCAGLCPRPSLESKAARAFFLGTTLGAHLLQLSPPQNLAIKTPSPRPQLHRKRNTFGLRPARRVHFRWTSNIRQKLPCALEEPIPTAMRRTPIARRTAVEKMAKGPARDRGGLCLYRKHNDFLNHQRASFRLSFANSRSRR
jgi:hypothetical protein